MKNKLLKTILLSTLISTIGIGSVFAAEETDYESQPTNVSDYSVKIKIEDSGTSFAKTNLEVTGLTSEKISTSYFVKFVDKDAPSEELNLGGLYDETDNFETTPISLKKTTSGKIMNTINDAFFITDKEYYAYVYNCTKTVNGTQKCKPTTESTIKVERDSFLEMTTRYEIYFFGKSSVDNPSVSIFASYPHASISEIPINLKVGIIEDSSVISAMAKNEDGALQKLYEYAKNATNGLTYSITLGAYKADTSNLKVQNGKYYYLYTSVEDSENKYIDLSDVAIVMGKNDILVNDVKYAEDDDVQYETKDNENKDPEYACYSCSKEYIWTTKGDQDKKCTLVDSVTEESKCVKNPKTGGESYLLPGIIVLLVGGTFVILLSNKSHFKKI